MRCGLGCKASEVKCRYCYQTVDTKDKQEHMAEVCNDQQYGEYDSGGLSQKWDQPTLCVDQPGASLVIVYLFKLVLMLFIDSVQNFWLNH